MAFDNILKHLQGKHDQHSHGKGGVYTVNHDDVGTVRAWRDALDVSVPADDGQHYYHATTVDKLSAIKNHGLTPTASGTFEGFSTGKAVSLAPSLADAVYWSSTAMWRDYDSRHDGTVRRPVLLRVPKYANVQAYRPDEMRIGHVPKNDIEILSEDGWTKP